MQTETRLDAVVTVLTFDFGPALRESDYPLLAELWDNAEDAEYDDA